MKKVVSKISGLAQHPFIKGSAIMLGGTMIANVVAYLYHLVLGRILGPVGYGELAALLSIFYILNSPSVVVQNILVKFFSQLKAQKEYGQAKRLFLQITRSVIVVEVALLIVLLPFVSMVARFLHITDHINLIWLYGMFAAFLLSIINLSVLQAFQLFLPLTVVNTISGVLRLILGAAGGVFGVGLALVGNVLASIVGYIATFVSLKQLLAQKEKALVMSPMSALYYSVPTFIAIFSITALYSQDVVLVKHFFSAQEAGIYSSLSVLGKIIFFASSFLGAVAFPMLAERQELGKPYGKMVFLTLVAVAFISFSITLVYFLFPQLVVGMLFGDAFMHASGYLWSFGLFISLFTLSYLLTTMYIALGKTGVWVLALCAAVIQAIVIATNHTSLSVVIWNNTIISGGLFVALLLYYPYATKRP
jgi:O-antigen/teichoic acid export membrane protein